MNTLLAILKKHTTCDVSDVNAKSEKNGMRDRGIMFSITRVSIRAYKVLVFNRFVTMEIIHVLFSRGVDKQKNVSDSVTL